MDKLEIIERQLKTLNSQVQHARKRKKHEEQMVVRHEDRAARIRAAKKILDRRERTHQLILLGAKVEAAAKKAGLIFADIENEFFEQLPDFLKMVREHHSKKEERSE